MHNCRIGSTGDAVRNHILLLLLAAASADARADRIRLAELANGSIYAESADMRRDGDRVTLRALFDLKTAVISKTNGQPYVSQRLQSEYDCREARWRVLSSSWHSGNMGEGRMVEYLAENNKWEPVPPGTGVEMLWQYACGSR